MKSNQKLKDDVKIKEGPESEEELARYAKMVIDERKKFCLEYKKDEDIDKCVYESVIRWIRLFQTSEMGSKKLGKLRIEAVEKLFYKMIKEGKIRYTKK